MHHVLVRISTPKQNFHFLDIFNSVFFKEKVDLQLPNLYNMHRYHEQEDDDDDNEDEDNAYTPQTETTSTTTTTTTTTTVTAYNPSVDMGQYCGACRYYSRRLHVKKYCKRDYSK